MLTFSHRAINFAYSPFGFDLFDRTPFISHNNDIQHIRNSVLLAAKMEPRGTLIGSNAAINSVDFDTTGSMVLATSNDYAT